MMFVPCAITSQPTREAVEMITGCCPATVYYSPDGAAVIVANDGTWVARVDTEGNYDSAYTSTIPITDLVHTEEPYKTDDLKWLEGFESGWEC